MGELLTEVEPLPKSSLADCIALSSYWWSGNGGFVNANGTRATTWDRVPNNGYLKQQGKWGNQALRSDNPDQQIIFGQEAWSDGATGPADPSKGLSRTWLCIKSDCQANTTLPTSDALQANEVRSSTSGGEKTLYLSINSLSAISLLFLSVLFTFA